jgi:hypothetical protein
MSPYRPQYVQAGTPLTAEFLSPLDFGVAVLGRHALDHIGSAPAADTTLSLRIVTPLDSRTVSIGSPVKAELTRPLFSPTRQLLFPVGAKVSGTVTEVTPARGLHRNGRLVFHFTKISPPDSEIAGLSTPQEIHGMISSIEVQKQMTDMRIAQNGDAQIFESKARFVRPVWSFVKTDRALDATSRSFVSIPTARLSPLGIGLGLYGASRSIYASFVGRGRDIILPANTSVELRLEDIKKP